MGEFWLPDETVVYIGMTNLSIGGRVGAFVKTPLGDRRPHAGGHWLKTLTVLPELRVWWAPTSAPEEYEDALLSAFAQGISPEATAGLRDQSVVLPWANLQSATDERKQHGIRGALLVDEAGGPVTKAERAAAAAAAARQRDRRQAEGARILPAGPASFAQAPLVQGARRRGRRAAAGPRPPRSRPLVGRPDPPSSCRPKA